MTNQTRTNQGGSVISFLIVGIVLTVVTLGVVYFIQQRGQNDLPGPIAGSPSVSPSPSVAPSRSPEASKSPAPAPSSSSAPTPTPSSVPSTGYLPQTGPVHDLVIAALPGALLIGVLTAFLRSRRARFGSFHR